jgi:hypothetical protein
MLELKLDDPAPEGFNVIEIDHLSMILAPPQAHNEWGMR